MRQRTCLKLGRTCAQFYVPWNFHERSPGTFKWDGEADVERFLDICQSLGLNVSPLLKMTFLLTLQVPLVSSIKIPVYAW